MKRITSLLFAAAVLAVVSPRVSAEDTNYWSLPYGPRSMLLGGSVIGSVDDLSSVYYNPGALGYIDEPEFLLSANTYGYSILSVEDGAGTGTDLTSSKLALMPNMLAGGFRRSWSGKNRFAYSFLTRHKFDAAVQGGRTGRVDVLPDPGEETFAGGVSAESRAREWWVGVTWAHAATGRVGLGVTTFLSIRNQDSRGDVLAQALTDSSDISVVYEMGRFSSSIYSLIWKAGLGIDLNPLTLGVTVTTPNLQIIGQGESAHNSTTVRVDRDGDGTPDNAFESNWQTDVPANYHSPLSVGFGAGYRFARSQLHFSVEWFDAVDGYDVLELEPFVSQTTGEVVQLSLRQQKEEVTNVALAVQHDFGKRTTGYLGFRTNGTSASTESDVSVTALDIMHLTGGASFPVGQTTLTVGLGYAWGSQTTAQFIDLDPDDGDVVDPNNQVELSYRRYNLLLGFRVGL